VTVRRICILGLDDYPLLSGEQQRSYIGGENVQRVLLARAWRDLGVDVYHIVHDHGQPTRTVVDGITTIAAHARDAGLPVLRFVHPRLTGLLDALATADADVYFQSCAGGHTGIVAGFCRATDRRFIFRVAHDRDCMPGKQLIHYWRDRKLFEYGLKRADLVAAQTAHQSRLLLDNYSLPSSVVNMAVQAPLAESSAARDIDVLWIANLQPIKRPELVLELARCMPNVRFVLAGGPSAGRQVYYDDMLVAAAPLKNLEVLGPVRYSDACTLFDRAKIFINTSISEGFPNTFLQAWIRGVPVVTFFDPDGLVQKKQLGWAANSLDDMREAIGSVLADSAQREAMGQRARTFAQAEFTPSKVANRYLELLDAAAQPRLRFGTAD
jgi:glycosyltransferase involved in cell wall biosynthesis